MRWRHSGKTNRIIPRPVAMRGGNARFSEVTFHGCRTIATSFQFLRVITFIAPIALRPQVMLNFQVPRPTHEPKCSDPS